MDRKLQVKTEYRQKNLGSVLFFRDSGFLMYVNLVVKILSEEKFMGEVVVNLELENAGDRYTFERGFIKAEEIRQLKTIAVVDTGAVMVMLPQDIVEELGLRTKRKVIVTYANEQKEEREIAGIVNLKIGKRSMDTDCIVGPPGSQPLVGQIVMEELDLIVDCNQKTLTPRPESPYLPLLNLK